jgi:hypothetical protein
MQPTFCRNCGRMLQPCEKFCPSCGTAIYEIVMQSTQSAPPAIQPIMQPSRARRMPSWGCLAVVAIALFILASFLYTTFKMVVAVDPAIVLSTQGKCQINTSRVEQFSNPWVKTGNNVDIPRQQLEYKAQVSYTLFTTDGRTIHGSSCDWMDGVLVNERPDQAQAIVNQYQVGHSYACWYNSLFPSVSALRQSVDWSLDPLNHATLTFIVGGFI